MDLARIEHTPLGLIVAATVTYVTLLLLFRWSGYRTIGRMSVLGFIVAITVGSAVAQALLSPEVPLAYGLLVAATLIIIEALLARITLYSPLVRQWVVGTPVALIEKGKVLEGNLHRHAVSVDRLMQMLRDRQAFSLNDVETAVLETNGTLTVQFKAEKTAVQPSQLGLPVTPTAGLPRIVINDGQIRQDQLYALGLSETWLMEQLAKRGYTDLQQIVVAQADPAGELYVDTADDFRELQKPRDKQKILAGLHKLQSDLASYSVETDDAGVQQQFADAAARITELLARVTPHLQA